MISDTINNLELQIGETVRMDCPKCSGRNTFTVTNQLGNMVYNCYKASCNSKGSYKRNFNVNEALDYYKSLNSLRVSDTTNTFNMPDHILFNDSRVNDFKLKWNITDVLGYDLKQNRAVFYIKVDNVIVDAVGRSLDSRLPKWLRYGSSNLPYLSGCGTIAVVVEDCISANTVSNIDKNFTGIALLGTSMTEETKSIVNSFNEIIVALDPDATVKTLHIAARLRQGSNLVQAMKLSDDIKYRVEEDLFKFKNILKRNEKWVM